MISASRLGLWSAVLTTVLTSVFFIVGILTPARSGPFCGQTGQGSCISYPYVNGIAAFVPIDYVWLYPGFLLALMFVVLMACIHYYASDDKKVFSQIGLSFASIYAAVITIDYFVQFFVVEPSIRSGETASLSLFTEYNPHGVFIGLEGLGYFILSVSFLFAAVVFSGGKLESAIRWLFAGGFVLAAGSLVSLSLLGYDIVAFEVTVLTINWAVLIGTGVMLSVLFKRLGVGGRPVRPPAS